MCPKNKEYSPCSPSKQEIFQLCTTIFGTFIL